MLKDESTATLRDKAETRVSERPKKVASYDTDRLIHELEVHQIELEMQNDELRRTQLEAEEARQKYFEFYDTAPVGYLTFNEEGIVLELNLTAAKLLGIEKGSLVNARFHRFIQPESQDAFYLHSRKALRSSTKQTCELVLRKEDGTPFHAQLDSIGVEFEEQQIIRTVLTDITERKQIEGPLAADLTALTRMHALSMKVMAEGEIQPVLQEIMDAAVAILGAQKGTLQLVEGDSLHIVAHHGHERPFLNFFAAAENVASTCGEGMKLEKRVIVEDVEKSPLFAGTPSLSVLRNAGVRAVQSTPVVCRKGKLQGILSTQWSVPHLPDEHDLWRIDLLARQAADIVEHARGQEALRQAREDLEIHVEERTAELSEAYGKLQVEMEQRRRLIAAIEQSVEGVLLLGTTNLEIQYANHAFLQLSGYTFDDLVGRDARILRGSQFGEAFFEPVVEKVTKGEIWSGDYPLKRKDGSENLAEITISPIKDTAGVIVGHVVTCHDVTKQRLLEAQLQQAQKMEALGTLSGGIAHDFNNMLAAIIGFTEMAADDVADRPGVERSLHNVLKSAMRARELVKQILAFSRKTGLKRTAMPLTPVIMDTVQLLRASIPTTIDIRFSTIANSDTILATPVEIQQILMNLATNAALAMEVNGGPLVISLTDIDFTPDSPILEPDILPGEYLQLSVKDTGKGMGPEVMKRVFEPFFTTREVGKGTGMGLAVVFGIVKDLQGAITVESEPGLGSTFRVFLPKMKTGLDKEPLSSFPVPGGTEKVLFVDDEAMLAEWGQTVLERLGYSVTSLNDSKEALKVFSSDPTAFDLVITDHSMPGMTGVQLSKALLKIRAGIPIILCTGHSETVSPERAKEAGIRQFLLKPLAKHELAEAVRWVLDTNPEA